LGVYRNKILPTWTFIDHHFYILVLRCSSGLRVNPNWELTRISITSAMSFLKQG
jgi:hypothetical protein